LSVDTGSGYYRCFSGSQLIADGIHSLSDLIADFVVLVANKKARKNQTKTIITDIIDMKMEHH
jgi:Co/Zn/Cd efflux system component